MENNFSEQELFHRQTREELQKMGINPYLAALYPTTAFSEMKNFV